MTTCPFSITTCVRLQSYGDQHERLNESIDYSVDIVVFCGFWLLVSAVGLFGANLKFQVIMVYLLFGNS